MKHFKFKVLNKKKLRLIIIGLTGLAFLCLYFSLPGLVKNALIAQAEKFGFKNLQFRVIHVGWQRLDLADLTAGDAADPALRIPFLSITYSPAGLWRKKIKNVLLVGVRIKIENRGQGFGFQGMAQPPEPLERNGAMVAIGRFDLEAGNLQFAWGQKTFEIPFTATLRAAGSDYSFAALLRPLAETVRLQGTLSQDFSDGKIAFVIPAMNMQPLIDQAGFGPVAWAKGRMAANGQVILSNGDFKTTAVNIFSLGNLALEFSDRASIMLDSISLAFTLGTDFTARDIVASARGRNLFYDKLAIESPFQVDIHGQQWPDLEFDFRHLRIARPLPVAIDQFAGKIIGPWAAARISGNFNLQNGPGMLSALGLPWEIIHPYVLQGNFQGGLETGEIAWTLRAKGKRNISIAFGKESFQGVLNLNAFLSGDNHRLRATVACRIPALDLKLEGYRARVGMFSSDAELEYAYGGDFRGRGVVNISGGNVGSTTGSGVEASGIRLHMPWCWTGGQPGAVGNFSVARLQSGDMRLQNINGILTHKDGALTFSGSMPTGLPQIVVSFQGNIGLNPSGGNLTADFLIPPTVLPTQTTLQSLHPLLRGLQGSGRFQGAGKIWVENEQLGSNANLEIADADFDHQGAGINWRGVKAEIRLNSLFDFVTAPAQRISFKELKWQDKSFRNGEVVFAGESNGTIFIESVRFDWCRGKIMMSPLRLEPQKTDFLAIFYCDRVNFAEMLNALVGKAIVSGDAEMNGIIPVKMVNGNPVFLDGYLYSTPGSSGQLKISQPEVISGGQVLVEEAIRDFRYNWIKIKMNSRNNRLDMIVSIDGAPNQKLPLVYDQKQKNFIKDPKGGRHVELKGLLLDIRFNDIDLKDLLKAGGQMTVSRQEK